MTKLHETLYRSNLANIKELIIDSEYGLKGEFVLVVDSLVGGDDNNPSYDDKRIMDILLKKLDKKVALEIGSEILQKKRNYLYQLKLKD